MGILNKKERVPRLHDPHPKKCNPLIYSKFLTKSVVRLNYNAFANISHKIVNKLLKWKVSKVDNQNDLCMPAGKK